MEITTLAARILEAFGPCTTLYECYTAREVAEELREAESILAYLGTAFTVEEIHMERSLYGIENEERHARAVQERKEILAGIKERLAALGYHL